MKRREVMALLVPALLVPETAPARQAESDFWKWVDEWNSMAMLGNKYAMAINEGRIDDAARLLPRLKKAGASLFCRPLAAEGWV